MAASLIINSPYIAPARHWQQARDGSLALVESRRPASYEILEIKGKDSEQNRAKRAALAIWVQAVNAKGGFGVWCWDVAFEPAQIQDILARH